MEPCHVRLSLEYDILFLTFLKTNMQIPPYPDFQKLQQKLHFDRKGNALLLIPTCLIGELAI